MSAKYAFEVSDVVKHYGEIKALDGVSLKAEEGKIFGLLGPNGAGKTTLVRILSTLLEPTSGRVKVHGIDINKEPNRVREVIGLAGQFAAVDEYLTGMENLYMVGRLYQLDKQEAKRRAQDILEKLHLTEAAGRIVKTYSGGMRRRLDVGASLVGHPKILFLDEPTTGLDPRTRLDLWDIIRNLVREGTSILLTTQYMDEADELADKIAVIDRGKVIAEGTSGQLKAKLGGDVVEFELQKSQDWLNIEKTINKLAQKSPLFDSKNHVVTVPVGSQGAKSLLEIVRELDRAKVEPVNLSLHQPSLDDVFLALTGTTASDVAKNSEPRQKRRKRK